MSPRKVIGLVFCISVLLVCCKKDDPKPLQAQVNAKLLAGEAGQSKKWRLIGLSYVVGSGAAQSQTLPGCFGDNMYTFTNNEAQDYTANEGVSKCSSGSPDTIESGTWAFTLDGLILTIMVDDIQSTNGLFAAEPTLLLDDNGTPSDTSDDTVFPVNIGYPYPAFVNTLSATSMVLEMNYTVATTKLKYTMTFTAQ